MKRLICGVALVAALATLAVTSAVAAGGKGSQTLTATCVTAGGVTVHASNGGSAWVNNAHWVVLKLTGTFTPTGGAPTTFTKVYGHKTGFVSRTHDQCSGSIPDPGGTFSFTVIVAKTTH
jgi:hypothetical protein